MGGKQVSFKASISGLCVMLVTAICVVGCQTFPDTPAGHDAFVKSSATVEQAKRVYRLGHAAADGTIVTWSDLAGCLPANWKPVCSEGGAVTPGAIGEQMKCSVHGQLPPEDRNPLY